MHSGPKGSPGESGARKRMVRRCHRSCGIGERSRRASSDCPRAVPADPPPPGLASRPSAEGRREPDASPVTFRLLGAALLLAVALLLATAQVPFGADPYDEGLIANGAALVLRGQWPVADYYAPYPPGAFAALALGFQFWGVRLIVERWFSAALAALTAVLGFWLISGLAGSRPASRREVGGAWLASLGAALLLGWRWVTPVNGGVLALVMATGLSLRAALPRGRPVFGLFCGGLAGAAVLWRLEFGASALAAGIVVWALRAGWAGERPLSRLERLAGALALGVGAVAVSGPPLAWVLVHGGHRAAQSLLWWPLCGTATARLPWTRHWTAFLAPLIALSLFAGAASRLRRDPLRAALALWLLLLGPGFLAYALGRTDAVHLLPLQVLSLLLAGLMNGARLQTDGANVQESSRAGKPVSSPDGHLVSGAGRLSSAAFLVLVVAISLAPVQQFLRGRAQLGSRHASLPAPRGTGVYPSPRRARNYARILAYLRREVPPGARLFCGTTRHDLFLRNDNLAYFLSGRESGTYYWCMDAGVTSTRSVQAEMVRSLDAARDEVVLIRTDCANCEANAGSHSSGVHLLDDYLHRCYRLAASWDGCQIYRRRSGEG